MKRRTLLASSLAVAGCAPVPRQAAAPEAPAQQARLLQLPPGVHDERAAFAALMRRELQHGTQREVQPSTQPPAPLPAAAAAGPGSELAAWLHEVPAAPTPPPARLRSLDQAFSARCSATTVLLVPGLFGDCVGSQSVPFGDGLVRTREREAVESYAAYADLGLHGLRMVPLPGRGAVAANGALLAEVLQAEAARPGVRHLVLVGYSKGLPDALQALALLQAAGRLPAAVQALVSVAGVVQGTPLAEQFGSLYAALSPHWQPEGCSPSDGSELADLTREARLRWLAAHPLPPRVQRYSLLAWAEPWEMALPLRLTHALLRRHGVRNDGQLLAEDAILPGSTLLATARSDHWDIALPRDRHPSALARGIGSGRHYPREALLRATLRWVVAHLG
jgi:hypothetical protein